MDNSALIYSSIGQFQKALAAASEALRIEPNDRYAYSNVVGAYEGLNRFDEARSIGEQAVTQKLDSIPVHFVLSDLAYIRGDASGYEHEINIANGTPDEPLMLLFKSGGLSFRGKIKECRETFAKARAQLISAGAKDFAATMFAAEGYVDDMVGDFPAARQQAGEALNLSQDRDARAFTAEVLAMAGDGSKAASIMAELTHRFPESERLRQVSGPRVAAVSALQANKPQEALEALELLRPYELGIGPNGIGIEPIYFRGLAYLKLKDGQKAAAEFQRALDHRGSAAWDMIYPLSRLGLARAYVLLGDAGKARTAYQDFFAAWKDADSDLPVLKDARAEYEKVK